MLGEHILEGEMMASTAGRALTHLTHIVKAGSQYDAGRCVASRRVMPLWNAVETQRDAGIEPNSIPA